MEKFKHCSPHNGKFTVQINILGHPCRTSAHFDTLEDAAITADLIKHYLRSEFKLDLPVSMDPEQFSSLAYSRRGVILSDSSSVFKSLPDDVKIFLTTHKAALCAYRESSPPETTASKFRRSDMMKLPAVRQWVESLEQAEDEARAFAAIDSDSFFLRLKVVASSLTAALKSLKLAIRMHVDATNPRLVQRGKNLAELVHNFQLNLDYVTDLTANLREEQALVESYVATLEANRSNLS